MKNEFYLIVDSCFRSSFAISVWLSSFDDCGMFKGILIRGQRPEEHLFNRQLRFHQEYAGETEITHEMIDEIMEIYGDFTETERAMIGQYGVPKFEAEEGCRLEYLGNDLNGNHAKQWLESATTEGIPYFFTDVRQLFSSFWMEKTEGRIFGTRSAVLPHARGVYAIENVAALGDADQFKQAAGVTIYAIDEGVDTGPLIRVDRIRDPFRFDSVWELKAYAYLIGYRLFVDTAKSILFGSEVCPTGIDCGGRFENKPYNYNDFNELRKKEAELGYLQMKEVTLLEAELVV